MPPLRSNPNVTVPADNAEERSLYERCENGELDGFQLYVHDFVHPDGGVGIPAYVRADADLRQIKPALYQEGITQGPLLGWALKPTALRHPAGYGHDVGSKPQELYVALVEAGRVAPTRIAAAADHIRRILKKPIKYDLYRNHTPEEMYEDLCQPTGLELWQSKMRNDGVE